MLKNCILVTGAAGFIGAAISIKLLNNGENVIGIDNINSYYDKSLKLSRLKQIEKTAKYKEGNFEFFKISIEDNVSLESILLKRDIKIVVHLAAQAGVRYSLENPNAYFQSNLLGFGNILELVRKLEVSNFIFASSSSVYGANKNLPFKEEHSVDHPVSLYAATKKSNEILAHSYSHLYKIPTTGLRFFTVYGPFGRPDMAPMIFIKLIIKNKPIKIFNDGKMKRDFTYIDDIVEGIFRCCYKPATTSNSQNSKTSAPYRIFNIGNGKPIELMDFISLMGKKLNKEVKKDFLPMQKGDVVETFASTDALNDWVNYSPKTSIEEGIDKFVKWYEEFYL